MSAPSRPRILIVNAALKGREGNTAVLLRAAEAALRADADVIQAVLADGCRYGDLRGELAACRAFVFGTGTHWDSWSHLLQQFLEDATVDEGTPVWLGKPAAVLVTEHAVGGKAVLSRLQGVLNTFGGLIPPMSGLVYGRLNQTALRVGGEEADDVWSPEDVAVVCHNLLVALGCRREYAAWPVDRRSFDRRWIS